MRYSFLESGSRPPSVSSDWSPVCKTAPRCDSAGAAGAKSYVRRRSACTFAVNTMLYFCGLFLAIRFSNQIAVMAVGIIGSLSGLFAAFLPKIVSFFLPWGYYIPLMGVQMIWDFETRIGWFEPVPVRFWLLELTLLLAVLFGALGWNALRKKEV